MSNPTDAAEREARQIAETAFPRGAKVVAQSSHQADQRRTREPASAPGSGTSPATRTSSRGATGVGASDGARLQPDVRGEMETVLGTDLSTVRVHHDSRAAELSRSVEADAFAYGDDVFFDHGRYDPSSVDGKRLLAQELAHTIQQRERVPMVAREGGRTSTLQCVNENLSSAGVASWLLAIVGTTCGLIGALAGSPTGPGAAGTAAAAAAVCIAGVIGFSTGAVLGIITGCMRDKEFRSRGAYVASAEGSRASDAPGTTAAGGTATA